MNTTRLEALRTAKGYHILPIRSGMQLELHEEVGEGSNRRIWRFKGLVIKVKKPNHPDGTFTIRGKTAGHTIEKIYPLSFPAFKKVLLLDEYKIRRAKLYYLRDKVGKDAKLKSILQKEEKNIDLLILALAEVEALKAAYDEKEDKKEVTEGETGTEKIKEEVKEEATEEATTPVEGEDKTEEATENKEEVVEEEKVIEATEEEKKEETKTEETTE